MAPPNPPTANMSMARATLENAGSPQGSSSSQLSRPLAPFMRPATSNRRDDGEGGDEAGEEDQLRVEGVEELPAGRHAGVDELMVEAHRRRQQDEQHERQPGQRIAEQFPARDPRRDGVPDDVGRQQPEVDERVAEPPEEDARQHRVDGVDDAQRPRNQQDQYLGRHAYGGPVPRR